MKLTYEELNNDQLVGALTRLSRQEFRNVKVAWNIQRIMRQMEKEVKEGREIFIKLLKENCEVDENGELIQRRTPDVLKEDGTVEPGRPIPGSFIVKDEAEFNRKNAEFMKIEVEIHSYYIKLSDLEAEKIKISPQDLLSLAPLINDLEEV